MRRLVTAGAVGRPHKLDGGFAVELPRHGFAVGTEVEIAGCKHRVQRRAGTDRRPLIRLTGVTSREAAVALRGELMLVADVLGDAEWLAEDLVGCRVADLGTVARIIDLPSCDALELEDGRLVPLISDAVSKVDLEAGVIEVHHRFLGIDPDEVR